MRYNLAQFASILFSPFVFAITGAALFSYKSTQNITQTLYWTIVTGVFTVLVAAFILQGYKVGWFSNLDISKRKERKIFYPFLVTVLVLFSLVVYFFNGPALLFAASLFLIPTTILFALVNEYIKGSIHTAVTSAASVGLAYYYEGVAIFLLILIPIIIWSRVYTRKHSINETIIGGIFGAILAIIGVHIVQFLKHGFW